MKLLMIFHAWCLMKYVENIGLSFVLNLALVVYHTLLSHKQVEGRSFRFQSREQVQVMHGICQEIHNFSFTIPKKVKKKKQIEL